MRRVSLPSFLAVTILMTAWHSGASASDNGAPSNDGGQAVASTDNDPPPSAADVSELAHFQLTDDFIAKYEAYEEEAAKNPCALSPMMVMSGDGAEDRSLDQTIAAFDARPGVKAALQRHGLSARETILGMVTLLGAAAQEMARQHPDMAAKGEISANGTISAANMAVYRHHKDEFHQHQMRLAREQLKANGGKLPACLRGG